MPTRVKICGITRPEDAALAAELGADAIGLNFVGGPRLLTPTRALEIIMAIPPLVEPVGLFTTESFGKSDIFDIPSEQLDDSIRTKQWYGDLSLINSGGLFSGVAGTPWWIVVHVNSRETLSASIRQQLAILPHDTQAILLDTATEKLGGTGQSFNWHWIAEARDAGELDGLPPIILAGGLTPDNVAEAIRIARPYAVDVSSGVEVSGKPGVKDPVKMREFIQAAKSAL